MKQIIILITMIFFIGCGKQNYIQDNNTLIYKNFNETFKVQKNYDKILGKKKRNKYYNKTKNILFDGYQINSLVAKSYFEIRYYDGNIINYAESNWLSGWSTTSVKRDYTFMLFTLSKIPVEKENIKYFQKLEESYKLKDNKQNGFVFQETCPKKKTCYKEWYKNHAKCYAKKLDEDTFLIARFTYPRSEGDKKLFQNEIIPTMLKSIKLTPTKISPWELY